MELQDKIIYLWEKGIIIFGTQLIFGRSNDVCYIYIYTYLHTLFQFGLTIAKILVKLTPNTIMHHMVQS